MWLTVRVNDEEVDVVPVAEEKLHTAGEGCVCCPEVLDEENGFVVVHKVMRPQGGTVYAN